MSQVTHLRTVQTLADHVAANVRAEAARRRVEQRDIGAALGLSQAAISDRYRRKTPWTLDEVERVARFLRVDLEVLLLPRLDSNQQPSGSTIAQVIDLDVERNARRPRRSVRRAVAA